MSTLEDFANVREIDADDAIKCCYANGWATDGLPVVPPESARVDLFIALLNYDVAFGQLLSFPVTGLNGKFIAFPAVRAF